MPNGRGEDGLGITQAGGDLRRSLVQGPAQSGVSYGARPGSSGLYPDFMPDLSCPFWVLLTARDMPLSRADPEQCSPSELPYVFQGHGSVGVAELSTITAVSFPCNLGLKQRALSTKYTKPNLFLPCSRLHPSFLPVLLRPILLIHIYLRGTHSWAVDLASEWKVSAAIHVI